MKSLYICHTVYQFLITLTKLKEGDDNEILIVDNAVSEDIKTRLSSSLLATVTEVESHVFDLGNLWRFSRLKTYETYFKSFDKIYLFLDHRQVGAFLHWKKIEYDLLEDGFNFFKSEIACGRHLIYSSGLKEYLFNKMTGRLPYAGASPYCQSIEVDSIQQVSYTDSRLQKTIEYPRKRLFDELSSERREQLLSIFELPPPVNIAQKSVLILTQPLYEIATFGLDQVSQKNLYRDLCQTYSKDYRVYLKLHPRDRIDYSDFQDVIFLEGNIPIEIFELSGYHFSLGITHSSTTLYYLTCFDEKIVLYKE